MPEEAKPIEIICTACHADTLLVRKPRYEGFTRVGETLLCASCGHEFASEESVHFKVRRAVRVFSEADKSPGLKVFDEDEKGRLCRYCVNYIVNPFTQWCSHLRKEVEATDSCEHFAKRPEPKAPPI